MRPANDCPAHSCGNHQVITPNRHYGPPKQRIGRVSLPFYRWSLTVRRSVPGYPVELKHIGGHILKRRLDLGLQQKEAARLIDVHPRCLENWEYGRTKPADRFIPG
jgi:hypothetical protein